jgi:capsular polysaccharide biosynthesis protein
VLLIERLPPQDFFRTAAKSKGGGTSRRSIPNHDELAGALQSLVRPAFEFENVRLEQIPFEEQVRLFSTAALVIGQHGAGLANCAWMQPGSRVVELANKPELTHFQRLSRFMGHAHVVHRTGGPHEAIDVPALISHLRREPSLADVLS